MKKIRLKFIDAMFAHYGKLPRSFLVDVFGVTELTASRDLKEYFKVQKEVVYDQSRKIYRSTENFKKLLVDDPVNFLAAIRVIYSVDFGYTQVTIFGVKK